MAYGFSPELPLTIDQTDGAYKMLKTIKTMGAQNLKMVVLTNPGERIMDAQFGVGINQYLFNQDGDFTSTALENRIRAQVGKYVPYINITQINIFPRQEQSNAWSVQIAYFIPGFATDEELFLNLSPVGSEGF